MRGVLGKRMELSSKVVPGVPVFFLVNHKYFDMKPNDAVLKIMTPSIDMVTVSKGETIARIKGIFEKNSFHHIPVMENEKLIGIISKSDFLLSNYIMSYKATGKTEVDFESKYYCAKDIMTEYPMCVDPEDTIGLVADIFLSNKFHSLPVLDEGELVGIVTSHDLLAYAFRSPIATEALVVGINAEES